MQSFGVLLGLEDDALQRVPRGLRFDDPDRLPVDVQEVVGGSRLGLAVLLPLERILPHSHAKARVDVHVPVVLNVPARGRELAIDLLAGGGCSGVIGMGMGMG